ncbi:type IV secretion system protein, partial [Amycolatopsis palatopharyngis]|uniref:type IV secretion system protein n=1 Tax=Amycolatopsis palatopharyngis TaxID=187982 RepID=UPI001FEBA81C
MSNRHRTPAARPPTPIRRHARTPVVRPASTTKAGHGGDSVRTGPGPGSGRDKRLEVGPSHAPATWRSGRMPRRRCARVLTVLMGVLAAVAGIALTVPATTMAQFAAAAPLVPPAQPPVMPLPPMPQPSCGPDSADPACLLPSNTQPPRPPGLPSTPLVPPPSQPPVSCFPGALMPECSPADTTPPPTSVPATCEGPNCIPQLTPLDPRAPGGIPAPGAGAGERAGECGITDPIACVTEAIDEFFRNLVADALNPLLELLGQTLLTTPEPSALPSVGQLWTESWQILLAVYVILVLIAGMVVMGYETLQTRYTIKEIGPRVVIGFLAGTLSLFLATKAIQIANALAHAVMGEGVSPQAAGDALTDMVLGALNGGGLWLVFIGLALAVMIIVLLITFIVRVMLTILLIAAAPIALMWHALPHTEGIAHAWWKAFGGVLAIQVGQSLALVVALRVFFAPGGFTVFGPTMNGLVNLLLCLALMWVLIKIPFWCLRPLSGGGRSMLGSLVRGAIAYKTMGLLGGAGALFGGAGGKGGGPRVRGGAATAAAADPASTRAGQFLLPMRVRRARPGPRRSPRLGELPDTGPDRKAGPGQMSLFTTSGSGDEREVSANPRALPPDSLPGALSRDQLGLPITTRREPERVGRRSVADDLAERTAGMPPPVSQPGLLTSDGRVNRHARPPAHLPRALVAPGAGMLPIHLRPAPPRTPRRTLADDLATHTPPSPPRPGLPGGGGGRGG